MENSHTDVPKRRRLRWLGVVALLCAAVVAGTGIMTREKSEANLVRTTNVQALPTVAVIQPVPVTKGQDLVLPGNIKAWYEAPIYARVSGYLKMWYKDIGARVKAGELLAVIDTPDLDEQRDHAKAELAEADANEKLAALTAQRWRHLLKANAVSQEDADVKEGDAAAKRALVQAAQANLNRLNTLEGFKDIAAPFDGIVTARKTDIGDLIKAGGGEGPELFAVADISRVRVYVQVPQSQSAQIAAGMEASLHLPQYPKRDFPATVLTTANGIDPSSRTLLVELVAANPNGLLLPGTYTDVTFHLPADRNVLRVPASALIFRAQGLEVATVGDDGKVAMKHVRVRRDLGDAVEVVAGVSPEDRIVDSPPDSLAPGEAVRVAGAAKNTPEQISMER